MEFFLYQYPYLLSCLNIIDQRNGAVSLRRSNLVIQLNTCKRHQSPRPPARTICSALLALALIKGGHIDHVSFVSCGMPFSL